MGTDVIDHTSPETIVEPGRRSTLTDILVRLVKEKPLGSVGGVITLLLLLTAVFAGVLAPYGMNDTRVTGFLAPPSARFPLGGDHLGRDVLSRIIYGARISVIVGLSATSLSVVISLLIGGLSGYFGGKFDLIVQRVVDSWMCFPTLIALMVIMSLVGPGLWQIIIVLSISFGIGGSRILRSAVTSVKENAYVKAATVAGCSPVRIFFRHIVPNIIGPTLVLLTTRVPNVILAEASLSFLGFGIPQPTPSWGAMLSGEARNYMFLSVGLAVWPGLALAITVFGINLFGDALRDILDPRMRGSGRRYVKKVKKEVVAEEAVSGKVSGSPDTRESSF